MYHFFKLVMYHYFLVVSIENSKEVLSLNPPEEDVKTESDSENEEVDLDVIRGRQKLSRFFNELLSIRHNHSL